MADNMLARWAGIWPPPTRKTQDTNRVFRQLIERMEQDEYRIWAHSHYKPYDPIDPSWHPVVQEECAKINASRDEYRLWAFHNYLAYDPVDPSWHPIIKEECARITANADAFTASASQNMTPNITPISTLHHRTWGKLMMVNMSRGVMELVAPTIEKAEDFLSHAGLQPRGDRWYGDGKIGEVIPSGEWWVGRMWYPWERSRWEGIHRQNEMELIGKTV